jgi:hypothetical protein
MIWYKKIQFKESLFVQAEEKRKFTIALILYRSILQSVASAVIFRWCWDAFPILL